MSPFHDTPESVGVALTVVTVVGSFAALKHAGIVTEKGRFLRGWMLATLAVLCWMVALVNFVEQAVQDHRGVVNGLVAVVLFFVSQRLFRPSAGAWTLLVIAVPIAIAIAACAVIIYFG